MEKNSEYFVQQINTGCLSQFSYYIESNGEAIVIDPMRDTNQYIEILNKRGAKLKYILETHFHADFVSGHIELNHLTGAKIVFGPNAEPGYEAKIAKDNELLLLGNINIQVIHTPGHTMESSSYLLLDQQNNPNALFTGDFLFLGETGRPDLAVEGDLTIDVLASLLYDSIQKIKNLPDNVIIYPGHGAGSPCGKNICPGSNDTLGSQRQKNWALNPNLSKNEFIEIAESCLPVPPQYFFTDVMLNKKGHIHLEKVADKSLKGLTPEEFVKIINSNDIIIIDTRDTPIAIKEFITKSYLVSLKMPFAIWCGTLFNTNSRILIIADPGKEKEAIVRLARVGHENVIGYAEGGYEKLSSYIKSQGMNEMISSLIPADYENIANFLDETKVQVIDVREKSEWMSTGIIPNSHLISLASFESNINKIKQLENKIPFGVLCKTGGRAAIAGSILKKYGIQNVIHLGGILNMIEKNVKFIPFR
jgi:glyoxylase-like metal-dependent hydrolase (beta-lactamase superfamily II)/rhodanese-related sulfurtransferase